jgi:hypothetical protein
MPNTQGQYERFLAKKRNGSPMTWPDLAARIDNEEEPLLHYMVENDFPQLWRLLHQSDAPGTIGQGMTFTPNKQRAEGELKLLLVKRDFNTLNDIIKHFRINMNTKNYTTNPDLIRTMEQFQTIVMDKNGYKFNVKIS